MAFQMLLLGILVVNRVCCLVLTVRLHLCKVQVHVCRSKLCGAVYSANMLPQCVTVLHSCIAGIHIEICQMHRVLDV